MKARAAALVLAVATLVATSGCTRRECSCTQRTVPGTTTSDPDTDTDTETATETATATATETETATETATATETETATETATATATARPDLRLLRFCRAQDNLPCYVRTLEGRALTEAELGLLVDVCHRLGLERRATFHMRRYLSSHPHGDRADLYRQQLAFEPYP